MSKTIFISIVIVAILIVGGLFYAISNEVEDGTSIDDMSESGKRTSASLESVNPIGSSDLSVSIKNFAFDSNILTVHVGDTVVWTNKDSAPHTVISDSGSELSSQTLSLNGEYAHTFTQTGTYSYYCSFHTGMKGKIIVVN